MPRNNIDNATDTLPPSAFSLTTQRAGVGAALTALGSAACKHSWERFLVVVAYATRAGAAQLAGELSATWSGWEASAKTFLVGLDWGHTEPEAIHLISTWPNSRCLIYDPWAALRARLQPRQQCFHPKVFAFADAPIREATEAAGIVGSCNLTGGGLVSNIESYVQFHTRRDEPGGRAWFSQLRVLDRMTSVGVAPDKKLLAEYALLRRKVRPPLPRPEPVPGGYDSKRDLEKPILRALQCASAFWTETLEIVENRGPGRAGNQVDLKKGARVFFGSTVPLSARINTPLGTIRVHVGNEVHDCEMRFGNNGMDKLNLPVPGHGTLSRYDHRVLCWERRRDGSFLLTVERAGSDWKRQSLREGTRYDYAGGSRKWGFYSGEGR